MKLEKQTSEQVCTDVGNFRWSSVLPAHLPVPNHIPEKPAHGTGHGHTATGYKGGLVTEMLKGPPYETVPST